MALIVQKFGGTSIGSVCRIRSVAERVADQARKGDQIVVVLSAMVGVTNQLLSWVNASVTGIPDPQETDVVISTGEQVTCGLLALALKDMGFQARSWTGWQLPLETDNIHGSANLKELDLETLRSSINAGEIGVVTGFQGVSAQKRITTLGRGGSDLTAVALAHGLQADRCDIYTDVDGVYTADPRIVPLAKKQKYITYEEMLSFSYQGAKVLQPQSVEMAKRLNVPLRVRSTFNEECGTHILGPGMLGFQENLSDICGLGLQKDMVRITIEGLPKSPGIEAHILDPLVRERIPLEMVSSTTAEQGVALSFSCPGAFVKKVEKNVKERQNMFGFRAARIDHALAKLSVVGARLEAAGATRKISQCLKDQNIATLGFVTAPMSISFLVKDEDSEIALRALHTMFGLDKSCETHLQQKVS